MHGQETVFKGYQVKQVEAELCYTPQLLEVKNILIQDTAGTIICPELKVIKNQQIHIWQLFSPKLIVKNFRPSLLQDMRIQVSLNLKLYLFGASTYTIFMEILMI